MVNTLDYKIAKEHPVRWYHLLKLVMIRCPECKKMMHRDCYIPGYDFWYCEDCKIIRD
jgi:hypothetical protein